MSTIPLSTFYDIYCDAVAAGHGAVFVGAGLSMPAGYVDWRSLLRPLAEDVGLDVNQETDLLRVAQYAINDAGGRARVNARLLDAFEDQARSTANHQLLARLPVEDYWTTNYDSLIEDALRSNNRPTAVRHSQSQLAQRSTQSQATVYKIHGDRSQPEQCVLAYEDYEKYPDTRGQFTDLLRGQLLERTFLFLGFSFTDPNIDHVLSRLRVRFGPDRREHFWLTKRVTEADCADSAEFDYRTGLERLRIRDLQRYGIQTILLESYQDITHVLQEILTYLRRRAIFVSGAAHDYDPLGQSALESFVRSLGERLVEDGYTLISGGGLNIGTAAVLGAVTGGPASDYRLLHRVRVTAFDPDLDDGVDRARRYRAYRERMLQQAGFAVFVSGNKVEADGRPVAAAGVEQEFDLAVQNGVIPVPVGATGHVAERLWRTVRDDPVRYFNDDNAVGLLDRLAPGRTDLDDMVDAVFRITHLYDGRRR